MERMKQAHHHLRFPITLKCLILCASLIALRAYAAELFVSPDGGQIPPYADWTNAAQSIQTAVDAAKAGDMIWVAPGTYEEGSTTNADSRNRVTVDKAVWISGITNREATIIRGRRDAVNTQVRCVYLGAGTRISHLTLADGSAQAHLDWNSRGGGLFMLENARADNCVIRNCIAEDGGGVAGPASSLLSNCLVEANTALSRGGGVLQAASTHSTIQSNVAAEGGGINSGNASCCIIRQNYANGDRGWQAGAAYGDDEFSNWTILYNCLIVDNRIDADHDTALLAGELGTYNCTIANIETTTKWYMAADIDMDNCLIYGGFGLNRCRTNHCLKTESVYTFANAAAGDFRPHPASPAINAGSTNILWPGYITGFDFGGRPRVVGGQVDIGAYEFQGATDGAIPPAWLLSYGLPTNQTANFADDDKDGYNTWQEMIANTNPTNGASRFKLADIMTNDEGALVLAWPAVPNRLYTIESTTSANGPWVPDAEIEAVTDGIYLHRVTNELPMRLFRVAIDLKGDP